MAPTATLEAKPHDRRRRPASTPVPRRSPRSGPRPVLRRGADGPTGPRDRQPNRACGSSPPTRPPLWRPCPARRPTLRRCGAPARGAAPASARTRRARSRRTLRDARPRPRSTAAGTRRWPRRGAVRGWRSPTPPPSTRSPASPLRRRPRPARPTRCRGSARPGRRRKDDAGRGCRRGWRAAPGKSGRPGTPAGRKRRRRAWSAAPAGATPPGVGTASSRRERQGARAARRTRSRARQQPPSPLRRRRG